MISRVFSSPPENPMRSIFFLFSPSNIQGHGLSTLLWVLFLCYFGVAPVTALTLLIKGSEKTLDA